MIFSTEDNYMGLQNKLFNHNNDDTKLAGLQQQFTGLHKDLKLVK